MSFDHKDGMTGMDAANRNNAFLNKPGFAMFE